MGLNLYDDLEANTPIYHAPGTLKVREAFSIRDTLKGCNVLITGGNSFVGSLAAAQLLAGCPDVGKVWLLVQSHERKSIVPKLATLIEHSIRNKGYGATQPPFLEFLVPAFLGPHACEFCMQLVQHSAVLHAASSALSCPAGRKEDLHGGAVIDTLL